MLDTFLNMPQQLRVIGFFGVLALVPFAVVMMTSFTRISIIFHFLRQALALQSAPSNHILMGLALVLTGFVMHPVIEDIHENAIKPYLNHEANITTESDEQVFLERAWEPLRGWMLQHTREQDMQLFLDIGKVQLPRLSESEMDSEIGAAYDLSAIPWYCVVPAFVISELRIAFMMGFLLFLPFLVIDMVISSVLTSLGMLMVPPVMISMPFKLLLFIVVDGWKLLVQQIMVGYGM
jgi:flagellar biosynthesis protein FliP